jgi:peptidyl-prolyl cis-trans isomerase D
MLDKFREGVDSPWTKILLALVIASFAVAGIGSYVLNNVNREVAEVNGEKITRQEFERQIQLERQRLGARFEQLYGTEAKLSQFKDRILDRLIASRLIQQYAKKLGLTVSLDRVYDEIRQTDAFKNADGEYDPEVFKRLLARAGYRPESYVAGRQTDMAIAQLAALAESELALEREVEEFLQLQYQKRSGRWLALDASLLEPQFSFDGADGEAELKAYYEAHKDDYKVPEQVRVAYIELNSDELAKSIPVTEDELKAYYDKHLDQFGTPEERRAAHILVAVPQDADKEAKAKARAKAESILKKLQAGENFAELAKTMSDDPGSAEKGGDLGFFGKGIMDPAFEEAVFSLKKGEMSSIVETPFGFHIIKLIDIKPAHAEPFEKVKEDVRHRLQKEKADLAFLEKKELLAEKAFEIADSLEEAAEAVGVTIKHSPPITREGGPGIFQNPALVEAAFSDTVLVDGYNSEVITLGENHVVVLRLDKHTPAFVRTFEEVRTQVLEQLRRQKAMDRAESLGQDVMEAARSNPDEALGKVPEILKAAWKPFEGTTRMAPKLPPDLNLFVFDLPHPKDGKAVVAGKRTQDGYAVVLLEKVESGAVDTVTEEQRKLVKERLQRERAMQMDAALQDWLKEHADIEKYDLSN